MQQEPAADHHPLPPLQQGKATAMPIIDRDAPAQVSLVRAGEHLLRSERKAQSANRW
jgi:hypothetical protein